VAGAVLVPGSGRIDGRLLREALERACVERGAQVIRARATLSRKGDVAVVAAKGQPLPAESVILAAGAWSAPLAASAGVTVPVYPQRGQIVHLEMPGVDTSSWPVVLGFHSHYLVAFPPNRVVAGATREDGMGATYAVTAGGVHEVLSEALRVAPGLSAAAIREVRVGFRPIMPDQMPALGRAPGVDNLIIATGHGPYGLQLGPYSGALAARLALGLDPGLDLTPYDPARFSA